METQQPRSRLASWLASLSWKDALKVVLALVLIGTVLSRTNLREIAGLSKQLSWPWLGASFLLFASMTALKAVQYWALLNRRVPYRQVAKIVVVQNALTNLVATAAGAASYLTMLRVEQNVKLSRSGAVFIITKAGDLFAMCLYLLLSAVMVWGRVQALQEAVIVLLAAAFGGIGIFWMAVFMRRGFVSWLRKAAQWVKLDRLKMTERSLQTLQSLVDLDHQTVVRAMLRGLALSLCYMTVTMAYAYCRIQAFRVPLDFWAIIFVTAIMQVISIIPIQAFGGLGVTEFTSLYLYQDLFQITQVDMAAVVIGMRVVFYLFNLGVLLYLPLDAFWKQEKPLAE